MLVEITYQINNFKYFPNHDDSLNPPDPTTVVPGKKRDLPLDGVHYTKICGMWTLKHDIRSPKFYELLIKSELKVLQPHQYVSQCGD